jgi:hypothetical protein
MKVGVKISGLSSSLSADAVVRLRDRVAREEEQWIERLRRRRTELRDDRRTPAADQRRT